ncbi:gluconate 2-dehydrogenase subunit 3 family protein [Bryobacter aggregatus]|uniref:gluconate 2-dehydrogenase subunit 3 family protein n=1 Tax=Bryobacter aggregatus TaxID=360054 RepID=UPI0004E124ED|nr:gluconate 2-dehydrogenase subunit 3 family protein [Bryobacter aggregatus]
MKRRSVLYSLLGVAPAALAWQDTVPNIPTSAADGVAMGLPRFFSPADLKSFQELGETLIPAFDGRPGAREAEAAEFLDFLLAQSPADLQTLYRSGVATWNLRRKAGNAAALKELSEPWTYKGSSTSYGKFLHAAKLAFHQATVNSRQWAEAMSTRSRSAAGIGAFWLPTE